MKWPRILGLHDGEEKATRPWLVEVRSAKWFILFVVSFAACTVSFGSQYLSRLTMLIIGQDIFMYGMVCFPQSILIQLVE